MFLIFLSRIVKIRSYAVYLGQVGEGCKNGFEKSRFWKCGRNQLGQDVAWKWDRMLPESGTGYCLKDQILLTRWWTSGLCKELKISSAFFWGIIEYRTVIGNRRFGKTNWSHLQKSSDPVFFFESHSYFLFAIITNHDLTHVTSFFKGHIIYFFHWHPRTCTVT